MTSNPKPPADAAREIAFAVYDTGTPGLDQLAARIAAALAERDKEIERLTDNLVFHEDCDEKLYKKLSEALVEIARLRGRLICTTCGGSPHPDPKRTCVCGGLYTVDAEIMGLREIAYDRAQEIAWLRASVERKQEALKPFAEFWDSIKESDRHGLDDDDELAGVLVEHWKNAREEAGKP